MQDSHNSNKTVESPARQTRLRTIRIRNYKSIDQCEISLPALTILVGRNGAGKSNFLDALRFVVEGLQTSLDHAIKSRGGIDEVRRRSTGHPRNFAIEFEMELPQWQLVKYGFEIGSRKQGGFFVKREYATTRSASYSLLASYLVENGEVKEASLDKMPPASSDRLYLVNAAGLPEFRPAYDVLISMGFYNLNPAAMKELQSPDVGELLHRDGRNIASVIARLTEEQPELKQRISDYLTTIVPGIKDVSRVSLGPRESLEFRQEVQGSEHPWKFYAASMSDGTLRALGALIAVTQLASPRKPVSLVGIEEPETALHPAAAGALMDALREASSHTQIIVTTHSPDLLDQIDLESDGLLIAQSHQGTTGIALADSASLEAIKNHLYTPGEMLRMDQLEPDMRDLERQQQLQLFDFEDQEES